MTTELLKLEKDEHMLVQVREHWFTLLLNLFTLVISAVAPFVFFVFFNYMIAQTTLIVPVIEGITNIFIALYASWLIILWMVAFQIWTNYYLDVWTITNLRLIAVDQRGFFSRNMASFRFERLQDVIVSVDGLIPTLLDYGTLEVQTASESRNFRAKNLPNPGELKAIILSATDKIMAQHSSTKPNSVT